jgi:hypothetical protein
MPRQSRNDDYPATVNEVLDRQMKFKPAALRAVRRFARSKPWQGTLAERKAKFRRLNRQLAAAYGLPRPRLVFCRVEENAPLGNGSYRRANHTIALYGKLSVVTYLHEFGHARGYGERQACRWSINLFRRVFPRSFARCNQVGYVLIRQA